MERFAIERVSIEVTNRCSKACGFCYNKSRPDADTTWTPDCLISFIKNLSEGNVRAISFGGGEPLEYAPLFDVLSGLKGILHRSITTNGLLLEDSAIFRDLILAGPEKVHVSIHFPRIETEVSRVIEQVLRLSKAGISGGVNLLVQGSSLSAVKSAAKELISAGIGSKQLMFLPMRGGDTPSPKDLAMAANFFPFQSTSCLLECKPSPRFCSISWDKKVSWCSYSPAKTQLMNFTRQGLEQALKNLEHKFCGGFQ